MLFRYCNAEKTAWVRCPCSGSPDLVLNDQRRAFAEAHVNLILVVSGMCVEISAPNTTASLSAVTTGR